MAGRPSEAGASRLLLLLDLDDTIFDQAGTVWRSLGRFRRAHPALRTRPQVDLARRYSELLEELHPSVLSGARSLASAREERIRRLFEWAGETIGTAESRRRAGALRRLYLDHRSPVPGARAFLRYARPRADVMIVTNNLEEEQREKLRRLGLERWIDRLVTSESVGANKPDPAIFREAIRRSGSAADRVVVLGDSLASDVAGARAAGLPVVWFNRFSAAEPEGSELFQIRSFFPPSRAWSVLRQAAEGRPFPQTPG